MSGSRDKLPPAEVPVSFASVPENFDEFVNGMDKDTLAQYKANLANNDKLEGLLQAFHGLMLAKQKNNQDQIAGDLPDDLIQALHKMVEHFIAKDYIPNDADKAVAAAFTEYMTALSTSDNKYNLIAGLAATLEGIDKNEATKQTKKPMHPALKAIIGGIIGAVVGAVICAAVGAGVTWYAAGVGAIPGFFVGLVKGFMAGSTVAMGITGAIGGLSLLTAGLFGGMNHAERKAVDAANAQNIMSADIRADVEAMRQFTPKKAS